MAWRWVEIWAFHWLSSHHSLQHCRTTVQVCDDVNVTQSKLFHFFHLLRWHNFSKWIQGNLKNSLNSISLLFIGLQRKALPLREFQGSTVIKNRNNATKWKWISLIIMNVSNLNGLSRNVWNWKNEWLITNIAMQLRCNIVCASSRALCPTVPGVVQRAKGWPYTSRSRTSFLVDHCH